MATQLTLRTHRKRIRGRGSRRTGIAQAGGLGGYCLLAMISAIVIIVALKLLGLY